MFYIPPISYIVPQKWLAMIYPQWPTMTLWSFFRYRSFCSCVSSYVLGNVRHYGPFSLRGRRCLRDRKKGEFQKFNWPPWKDPQSRPPNLILFHSLFCRRKSGPRKRFIVWLMLTRKTTSVVYKSEQETAIREARTWDPRLLARDLLTATQATRMRKPVE